MIQFNLLPDVKKQYVKAKRTKRLITSISLIAAAGSIAVVALLFSVVQLGQKGHINRLTDDIKKEISAIKSVEDLDKILTIQHQLESLPGLHQTKSETSRIFTYLNQSTPVEVKISSVEVDFLESTMSITGTADSLASVNKYADTLKFVSYRTDSELTGKPFSGVTTELNRNEERASYTIELIFDPIIFDNTVEVTLIVPEQITTRSVVGKPTITGQENSLFEPAPIEEGEEN